MKSLRGQEKRYQKELNKLGRALIKAINEQLLPYLKADQEAYVLDGIGDNLATIFRRLNQQFTGAAVLGFAESTSREMVTGTSKANKSRFDKAVKAATGINLGAVIAEEGIQDFVELSVNKNVSLIKSLPEEYLKQVETIVNNGVINGSRYSDIAKQIQAKTGSTNSKLAGRIKTIAMNEVSTINAQISQRRATSLGVERAIWRTSEDEVVRECHKARNGKEFDLKKGLYSSCDGLSLLPGEQINCRCSFSPIIEVDQ